MNETKSKSSAKVGLIAIIVVIALLLALLVPTLVNVSKMGKQFKSYQEETNQQLADLKDKMDKCQGLTLEQVQSKIAEELKKYSDSHPAGITDEQIADIVDAVLAKVPAAPAGLTQAQVQKLINDALKKVDVLTEEDVKDIIDAVLKKDVVETADPEELKAAVEAGKNVKLTGNVDLRYVIVPANTELTLDLNGKTLSVYEIEVQGNGKLNLKNGSVSVDGYVYVGNAEGVLVIENVDVKHKNNDGNCVRNHGTAFISDSTFTATGTADGEALLVNWGTMVVNDSEVISVAKAAKPEDFAVYNSGTMTLNRVKVTANAFCVMNVDLKEDDGFTAVVNINGGTYTSKNAVVKDIFDSIYVANNSGHAKMVMTNNVKLVAPVLDAGIRSFGELVGVSGVDYTVSVK